MATINEILSDVNTSLQSLQSSVNSNLSAASNAQELKSIEIDDLSSIQDGAIFRYNSSTEKIEPVKGLGDLQGAGDGDLLKFNASTGLFEVATPDTISFAMGDLSDTPDAGKDNTVLVFDGSSGEYINRDYNKLTIPGWSIEEKKSINIVSTQESGIAYDGIVFASKGIPVMAVPWEPFVTPRKELDPSNGFTGGTPEWNKTTVTLEGNITGHEEPPDNIDVVDGFCKRPEDHFSIFSVLGHTFSIYYYDKGNPTPIRFIFNNVQTMGCLEFGPIPQRNGPTYQYEENSDSFYRTKMKLDLDIIAEEEDGTRSSVASIDISNDNKGLLSLDFDPPITNIKVLELNFNTERQRFQYINLFSETVNTLASNNYKFVRDSKIIDSEGYISRFLYNKPLGKFYFAASPKDQLYEIDNSSDQVKKLTKELGFNNISQGGINLISEDTGNRIIQYKPLTYSDYYIQGDYMINETLDTRNIYDGNKVESNIALVADAPSLLVSDIDNKLFMCSSTQGGIDVLDISDIENKSRETVLYGYTDPKFQTSLGYGDVHEGNRELYVPSKEGNEVLVISTIDYTILTTISVCPDPTQCTIDENLGKGIVIGRNQYTVFNVNSKAVETTSTLQEDPSYDDDIKPQDITINRGKEQALISIKNTSELVVIDLTNNNLIERIPTEETPRYIEWDGDNDRLLLSTYEGNVKFLRSY